MKFKARRELKRTKIEIIPMIDTMFFLLVFFMLSSLSMTHLHGLKVHLPKAETASSESATPLTLTIMKDKTLLLNGKSIAKSELIHTVKEVTALQHLSRENTTFIINADADVPHGFVVECIDDSRAAGITHFAIATSSKKR